MEQLVQSLCSSNERLVRRTKLQLPALILICTISYSWSMDTAERLGGDVTGEETRRAGSQNEGQANEQVIRLLETDTQSSSPGDLPCWKTEKFSTEGPCQACDEHAMRYASYCCSATGFRQLVRCQTSHSPEYKSCPKTQWALEHSFWTFEGVMLAVGLSSFIVVIFRRRALDWEALQRVKKQIANSV